MSNTSLTLLEIIEYLQGINKSFREIDKESGMSNGTFARLVRMKQPKAHAKTLRKLSEYVDSLQNPTFSEPTEHQLRLKAEAEAKLYRTLYEAERAKYEDLLIRFRGSGDLSELGKAVIQSFRTNRAIRISYEEE